MKTNTHSRAASGKALALALTGLFVALSVQAAERTMLGDGVATVTVSYGDLDLGKVEGTKTLYARLGAAARQVCGGEPDLLHELQKQHNFRSCYDQALEGAVRDVDNARLQALHEASKVESSVS